MFDMADLIFRGSNAAMFELVQVKTFFSFNRSGGGGGGGCDEFELDVGGHGRPTKNFSTS